MYATVTQLRAYLPQIPTYGQQTVTVTGSPTGGDFKLSFEGVQTAVIAHNATASAVQTALRALAGIGSSGVKVSGPAGGPWVADFTVETGRAPLSLGTNSLTGGTSPSVTVANTTEALLTDCLTRATDIVRGALAAGLADPDFDYAAYGVATTKLIKGYDTHYLSLPPHQAGSVTLVEYESGANPPAYSTLNADQWDEESGQLYRASGWSGGYSRPPRYRVTAIWGYGATVPAAIEEVTLELAVNIWRSRDTGGFTEFIGVEGGSNIRMIAGLNAQQRMIIENQIAQLYQVHV